MIISNRLKELREERLRTDSQSGLWTQEGLAKRLGVTRRTIISIEKGAYNPTLLLAFKLAHAFNTAIEDIFQYKGE
ncbi:MAG: helix-turn-helix transcriptional regulator [Candidatus Thorarchaeota archaeon]|jgi:putative transcriptional regulator